MIVCFQYRSVIALTDLFFFYLQLQVKGKYHSYTKQDANEPRITDQNTKCIWLCEERDFHIHGVRDTIAGKGTCVVPCRSYSQGYYKSMINLWKAHLHEGAHSCNGRQENHTSPVRVNNDLPCLLPGLSQETLSPIAWVWNLWRSQEECSDWLAFYNTWTAFRDCSKLIMSCLRGRTKGEEREGWRQFEKDQM